jgi:hypothetical protein
MAQEGSLASVFDSISMFQPQSYAIKESTTQIQDTKIGNIDIQSKLSKQLYTSPDCYQFLMKVLENNSVQLIRLPGH